MKQFKSLVFFIFLLVFSFDGMAQQPTGCMDTLACNYDTLAWQDDGSCYNNDLGCGCDQPGAELGYDCDGNQIPLSCGTSVEKFIK